MHSKDHPHTEGTFIGECHLDIFETPVTVTPQQEISKSLKFFQNSLKILNVCFWGDNVYCWGDNFYFWGDNCKSSDLGENRFRASAGKIGKNGFKKGKNRPKMGLWAILGRFFLFLGHFFPIFAARPKSIFGLFSPDFGQKPEIVLESHTRKALSATRGLARGGLGPRQDVHTIVLSTKSRSLLPGKVSVLRTLVGLRTQMQNATFFERKGPERKSWPRGKPLNRKKRSQCVF